MPAIIQTTNLTRQYGEATAVRNLNLAVPENSIYAFLGTNGAGKTTTIKMLLNIIEPTEGYSEIFGVKSSELGPTEWQKIGYVSENQDLPEWMTTKQLIDFCRPLYPTWDDSLCLQLQKDFELPLKRQIKDLSRGMQMKVSLLTSLAYRPRLLVLDEPFTGLDPLMRADFISSILRLTAEENWTVFLSSHDIEEVERLANHIGIIHSGELCVSSSAEYLKTHYQLIEVTLPERLRRLPENMPKTWLTPEINGPVVHFLAADFTDIAATEKMARTYFPEAREFQAKPVALREVFLALARTFRNQQPQGELK